MSILYIHICIYDISVYTYIHISYITFLVCDSPSQPCAGRVGCPKHVGKIESSEVSIGDLVRKKWVIWMFLLGIRLNIYHQIVLGFILPACCSCPAAWGYGLMICLKRHNLPIPPWAVALKRLTTLALVAVAIFHRCFLAGFNDTFSEQFNQRLSGGLPVGRRQEGGKWPLGSRGGRNRCHPSSAGDWHIEIIQWLENHPKIQIDVKQSINTTRMKFEWTQKTSAWFLPGYKSFSNCYLSTP